MGPREKEVLRPRWELALVGSLSQISLSQYPVKARGCWRLQNRPRSRHGAAQEEPVMPERPQEGGLIKASSIRPQFQPGGAQAHCS